MKKGQHATILVIDLVERPRHCCGALARNTMARSTMAEPLSAVLGTFGVLNPDSKAHVANTYILVITRILSFTLCDS